MQDLGYELPRKFIPRTRVNKPWVLLRAPPCHSVDHLPFKGGYCLRLVLRRPKVFDTDLGGRSIQLLDVRLPRRGQGPLLRRLPRLRDEALEAGGQGDRQGPKRLVSVDGVAVGDATRQPHERSGRRLPRLVTAGSPHRALEDIEPLV